MRSQSHGGIRHHDFDRFDKFDAFDLSGESGCVAGSAIAFTGIDGEINEVARLNVDRNFVVE